MQDCALRGPYIAVGLETILTLSLAGDKLPLTWMGPRPVRTPGTAGLKVRARLQAKRRHQPLDVPTVLHRRPNIEDAATSLPIARG